MMSSAGKAMDAYGHATDARDFVTGVVTVATGKHASKNREELAEHVGEMYDGHVDGVEGAKELLRNTWKKVSERGTDDGPEVDDGLVEEVNETFAEGGEAVGEHLANCEVVGKVGEVVGDVCGAAHDAIREGVTIVAEGIHGAVRGVHAAGGISSEGMPAVNDGAEVVEGVVDKVKSVTEGVATSTVEAARNLSEIVPSGAVRESIQTTTEEVGNTVMKGIGEIALDAVVEEAAEAVAEMIPIVGVAFSIYSLVDGVLKAGVGATGLAVGGTVAVLGGAVGGLAAPFDGGATWGGAMKVAGRTSAWSGSMAGEGTLTAVKGTVGLVNQVPGSQIATVPIKIGCRMGAGSLRQLRMPGGEIDSGDDDCGGAISEKAIQVEKMYQLVSADGKRVVRAASTKSRRGYKYWLGHGGYSLTFGDPQSAEAEEDASSFSFSGGADAYRLHSGMYNNNTLFFMGATYPAEWVVWDVEGKTTGEWEKLQLKWQEGGQKFKIKGHGGQYAEWVPSKGIFEGGRTECEATDFVLKEKKRG